MCVPVCMVCVPTALHRVVNVFTSFCFSLATYISSWLSDCLTGHVTCHQSFIIEPNRDHVTIWNDLQYFHLLIKNDLIQYKQFFHYSYLHC